ncbi:hypothetical protein BDV96DRAFT_601904 [Lophiotrema nucula]|uniref:Uncharacterized protein n=1 Tax=Lophiotrema nucula TaxID=690887 RepID=A0A6A5Z135_9PLEO|nr:hypothetical protein BDV96DRAFT_601904 [Lophiotrema nucula]
MAVAQPATQTNRHTCVFKMPRNPKYKCPGEAEMFDPLHALWYCKRHDPQIDKRCQVLIEFRGHQCTEMATSWDEKVGKRLCDRHVRFEEREGTGQVGGEEGWTVRYAVEPICQPMPVKQELSRVEEFLGNFSDGLDEDPSMLDGLGVECSEPVEFAEVLYASSFAISNVPRDIAHALPMPHQERVLDVAALGSGLTRMRLTDRPAVSSATQESRHIAASYVQCNICLEKHDAATMHRLAGCNHQYSEDCLQNVLTKGTKPQV